MEPGRTRPLVGEPLAMDLLNTRWVAGGTDHDLLDSLDGLRQWFGEIGGADRFTADEAARENLLLTRDALARLADTPGDPDPEAAAVLNRVLGHGAVYRFLDGDRADAVTRFDDPAWAPAWSAAADYLDLLSAAPDRIRRCAGHACVLRFYDTSRNGTRRWCSMAGCGNRAKAARHHARERDGGTTG
ncbi:CGNR zinc finger domain-containing protein [Nocardiopsis sp. NPDC058631]|uniref:CGNR zinc finger domain-containing protein n=1 Tax=Nocardiopsis sp. NPDC058631 TaxID=3346566 RepID=UPI003657A8E4